MGIWASPRSGARRADAELRKLPRHLMPGGSLRFSPASEWSPSSRAPGEPTSLRTSGRKARQFGQTSFLGDDTDQVVTNLGRIENHLNRVLELWEESICALRFRIR
jgi:hypothetical protein